jgi:hypothetical protein
MVEPLDDFDVEYDGQVLKVRAGTGMWFGDDHEVVRRFPDRFGSNKARARRASPQKPKPARVRGPEQDGKQRDRAGSTASGGRVAGSWLRFPNTIREDLRIAIDDDIVYRPPRTDGSWWLEERGPITVSISDSVRESIAIEVERWQNHDDVETGGPLAGLITGSHLRVTVAHPGGPSSWHGKNRVSIPGEAFEALDRECKLEQSDATICGDWHSHPSRCIGTPSGPDRRAWAAQFEHLNRRGATAYLGLIVTPSRRFGWAAQTLHAWMLRRDGSQIIVEQATIK